MEVARQAIVNILATTHNDKVATVSERVRCLERALISGGSDGEWRIVTEAGDLALPRKLIWLLHTHTPAYQSAEGIELGACAIRLLLLLSGLYKDSASLWCPLINHLHCTGIPFYDGATALLRCLLSHHSSLRHLNVHQSRQAVLTVLTLALPAHEALKRLLLDNRCRRLSELSELICAMLQIKERHEAEAIAATQLLICLHGILGAEHNELLCHVVHACPPLLMELLLHELNAQGYPSQQMPQAPWTADLFRVLVLTKPDYLHMKDVEVIIDIIVREVANLPSSEVSLLRYYIQLLDAVLHRMYSSTEGYKAREIGQILGSLRYEEENELVELVQSCLRELYMHTHTR